MVNIVGSTTGNTTGIGNQTTTVPDLHWWKSITLSPDSHLTLYADMLLCRPHTYQCWLCPLAGRHQQNRYRDRC